MNYKYLIIFASFLTLLFTPSKTLAASAILTPISITSNNIYDNTFAKAGDEIILTFTAERSITNVSTTALSRTATITNTFGNTWQARLITQVGDAEGNITFTIDYQDVDPPNDTGQATAVTDGSTVIIDLTAPSITQVTQISSFTADQTPDYRFNTDEAGTIVYGGACSSSTTSAIIGDNIITLNPLLDGTYTGCSIMVNDPAGNSSTALNIPDFTIDTIAPVFQNIGVTSDNMTNPSYTKVGDTLSFDLTLNALDTSGGGIITFDIGAMSGLTTPLVSTDTGSATHTGTYTVQDGQNGAIQVTDITFTDNVTNSLSGFTGPQIPSPTIIVDTLAPHWSRHRSVQMVIQAGLRADSR